MGTMKKFGLIPFLMQICICKMDAAGLARVWQIDLRKDASLEGGLAAPVFAIRFSPDGKNVAVIVGSWKVPPTPRHRSRLLIYSTESARLLGRFEVSTTRNMPSAFGWGPFEWPASGDSIVAGVDAIQLSEKPEGQPVSGHRLTLPGDGHLGAAIGYLLSGEGRSDLEKWKLPSDWTVEDVDTTTGLVCFTRNSVSFLGSALIETGVWDFRVGKIIQRWSPDQVSRGDLKFVDRGTTLCEARPVTTAKPVPVRCWDVKSGEKTVESAVVNGGQPMAAATQGTRLILSDVRYFPIWFTDDGYGSALRRRIIWDFKTGRELASWHPREQTEATANDGRVSRGTYRSMLSPDGTQMAEGGDGILALYRIK